MNVFNQQTFSPEEKHIELWHFYYYKWAETHFSIGELPSDLNPKNRNSGPIYYKGTFEKICGSDLSKFVNDRLFPGLKNGYITMDNKYKEAPQMLNYMGQEVTIRFDPKKIVSKMHLYLAKDVFEDHCMAMESCGWYMMGVRYWRDQVLMDK